MKIFLNFQSVSPTSSLGKNVVITLPENKIKYIYKILTQYLGVFDMFPMISLINKS